MKPEKEGHDSINNFIRQTIGKDPFSRSGGKQTPFEVWRGDPTDVNVAKEASCSLNDNGSTSKGSKSSSEQMQALRFPEAVLAFAQAAARANGEPEKYLPGWPLLSPPKVQFQKCEKCSRELCSTLNYRRHILVHRRSLNIDKDFSRNREFLAVFWDKLPLEDRKDILSFTNMDMEEVNGSSLVKSLSSWIRKPLFSSLPQAYAKAGSTLLDLIQEKPSSSHISSEELFSILDNASEKTFLSTGTAISVQKFVFDGEVSKIALEMKNLISCVSFMLEQRLVKAWHADKDAEALKCHKLLMEEEESAKRRQDELIERKRLKKLKQKEQKTKDLLEAESRVFLPGAETSDSPRLDFNTTGISEKEGHDPVELNGSVGHATENRIKMETEVADQSIDQDQMNGRHPYSTQYKPKRTIRNGYPVQFPGSKFSLSMRYDPYKEPKTTSSATSNKIWTQKNKREEAPYNRSDRIHQGQSAKPDSSEVIIGSICIALGSSDKTSSKPDKIHTRQHNIKPSTAMLWKPVSHHENRSDTNSVSNMRKENFGVPLCGEFTDSMSADKTNFSLDGRMNDASEAQQDLLAVQSSAGPILFSSKIAEAFLAQRWKEAIVSDHVRLVLPSEAEVLDEYDTAENDNYEIMPESCEPDGVGKGHDSFGGGRSIGAYKLSPVSGSIELSYSFKPKFRTKTEKNSKLKYVPKQTHKASGE
ncbi:uncharacterized protein LOC141829465 isoform X1 [Curcuma longa]|uniref:uncharacterized protein LOC141829465 isoform X1 n=1 Tax=Curcuma longa TaxID=136217 RepID=UPI003D9E2640